MHSGRRRFIGVHATKCLLNSIDASSDFGSADRIIETPQTQPGEQIGQVFSALLNRDHFAYFEISAPNITYDDAMFSTTFNDHDNFSAVGEIACFAIVM